MLLRRVLLLAVSGLLLVATLTRVPALLALRSPVVRAATVASASVTALATSIASAVATSIAAPVAALAISSLSSAITPLATSIAALGACIATLAASVAAACAKAASGAGCFLRGLVDTDLASVKFSVMHCCYRSVGSSLVGEAHETETAAATGVAVLHDDGIFNLTKLLELFEEGLIIGVP